MSKIPVFKDEEEESDFWDTHEITDYLGDTIKVDITFIDARPNKTLISLQIGPDTIARLKEVAGRKGVGYQTLIRMWVIERLNSEPQ